LRDARVRQAFNYAVNKGAILSSVLFDLGTVVDSPCPAGMFGYGPVQAGGWPFNPIKAKQLLAEAGYPSGFEVTFFTPTGRYIQDFQVARAGARVLRERGGGFLAGRSPHDRGRRETEDPLSRGPTADLERRSLDLPLGAEMVRGHGQEPGRCLHYAHREVGRGLRDVEVT